jgi:hypothetical protein
VLHALCLSAFLSGQAADVATSLAKRGPSYYEANPLVPSGTVPFVALKAGLTSAVAVAVWRQRKTHPKRAVCIFLLGAAAGFLPAVHNARLP